MNRTPRLTVLAAAMLVLSLLAACGAAERATTSPPVISSPTFDPVAPSPSPEETAAGTAPTGSTPPIRVDVPGGAIMQVVADELRIRAEPGTSASLRGTLARGTVVRVESGPTEADGFTWYEVTDTGGRQGWAAEGDGSDPWLMPTAGATDGTAMLSLAYICDIPGPIGHPATTMLDDGRVIVSEGEWTVRRLSEAGMSHLRETILGSPYLQTSADYRPEPRADAGEAPGHGVCLYTFTLPTDVEPIVVTAVGWFGDEEEATFYQPSPERRALTGIARNLLTIDEVLDEDDWEDPAALPYVASEFMVWLALEPGPAQDWAIPVDASALPFGDLVEFGAPAGRGRCEIVGLEVAFEIARVLNGDSGDTALLHAAAISVYRTDANWFTLAMVPRTPDGKLECNSVNL